MFPQKYEELQKTMQQKNVDFLLLINTSIKDPNILYSTGLDLEYCALLVPQKSFPIFFVSEMEFQRAKQWSAIKNIEKYKKLGEGLARIIKENNNKKSVIGINAKYITLATFKELKKQIKDCHWKRSDMLWRNIRITKTPEEIKYLQKAATIADNIFSALIKELKTNKKIFKTEKDIADFMEQQAKKQNTVLSFETIVASGKNGAMPHYTPQKIPLQKGFCVLDFGVRYKNYISDISRTIFFGRPTREELQNYKKVKEAQDAAFQALHKKKNQDAKIIDAISRKKIQYPHSLGHGIGIEVHEAPSLSPKSKDVLKENMCFTLEPGIYIPNKYGIRIEDDIWLSKKGPVLLTKSSRELFYF